VVCAKPDEDIGDAGRAAHADQGGDAGLLGRFIHGQTGFRGVEIVTDIDIVDPRFYGCLQYCRAMAIERSHAVQNHVGPIYGLLNALGVIRVELHDGDDPGVAGSSDLKGFFLISVSDDDLVEGIRLPCSDWMATLPTAPHPPKTHIFIILPPCFFDTILFLTEEL